MPLCLSLLLPIIPFASLHHVFALSFFHLSLPYLHCLATFFPPAPPHFLYHSVSLPLHHFLTLAPLSLIFLCQMSFYLSQSLSVRKPCSVHIGRKARQTPNGLKMERVAVILPLCVVLITHLIIALDLFYQEKQVAIAPPERPVRSWQSPIPHPQHLGKPAASGFAVTMSLSTNFWITMPISRLTGLIRYEGVKNLPAFVHLSNWSNTEKPFTSMRTQTKLHSQPGPHCLW